MIHRIWTVLNLNLTQMKFYEGILTNPTQTLLSHLDKSLTDLNVKDLSLYRSDFRLALLSFDLLRNFSSVTGVVYASSLLSLWCVPYSFFKKSVLGSKFDNKSTEKHMEIREYPLKSNKKLSSYRATKRHVQKQTRH
jgi:hypothetical protein